MASTTSLPTWDWTGTSYKKPLHGKRIGHVSPHSARLLSALRRWQGTWTPIMNAKLAAQVPTNCTQYSVVDGAQDALKRLCELCHDELPGAIRPLVRTVEISSGSGKGEAVHFPTPLKEQDAVAAIKGLEACLAAAIADLRYGMSSRKIQVDTDKVSTFLMSAYLTTLDGMGKADPRIREKIPDTDLNQAQSVLYRRLSANLYRTKNPGEYYHIHGSLDADVTLEMLGLPKHNPELTDYRTIINHIESAVMRYTTAELDQLNLQNRQAGIQALTWDQFQRTPHGRALAQLPPLTVRPNPSDTTTPPVPFPPPTGATNPAATALRGIKVLELCRIIAGPTIGRSLAAHGASVLKVTSPHLPDVPFFQLDVNTGKHAVHLDLKNSARDRQVFAGLLEEADVLIDGYRPGALARLGYGAETLGEVARKRGRGYVYVVEDCFGGGDAEGAEWASRAGWQQIADCVTGVAWAQGEFMGLDEPVVPPFPMSDYGTGALGCVAALAGLYRRATEGGSWVARTSLCQYDCFLMGLGMLPAEEQTRLREVFGQGDEGDGFFALRHSDSVDEVGKRALAGMRRTVPHLFEGEGMMHTAWSEGFKGVVKWPSEAVHVEGLRVGHVRTARPNGFDVDVGWEDWEEDEIAEAVGGLEGLV
ncbi:hypothetical protein MFIFM68171_10853 [Madurella fahalii]|uniref:CoA-transferase family III n=1 Tax=Madurella fahalii TaxID=1157608 RepID=A0ABQ0GSB8_9PEZI